MDASGPLRPLTEAADSIRRLHEYHTLEELGTALERVHVAVQSVLRLRLRDDPSAPESERLSAFSEDQLPMDRVIRSLRSRDLISLHLAGKLHELDGVVARARDGDSRPDDADVALRVLEQLRAELAAPPAPATGPGPQPTPPLERSAARAVPAGSRHAGRWMAWLGAALAALMLVGFAWVLLRGRGRDVDAAIVAFRAGRLDSAEVLFQQALARAPDDVTTRLYLARIQRRQGRLDAAASTLRKAAEDAPDDPAVRRELGHLFLDVGHPEMAARQYELALERAPEDAANWTALIRAQRMAGDPRADSTLARAPAEVQAGFGATGG